MTQVPPNDSGTNDGNRWWDFDRIHGSSHTFSSVNKNMAPANNNPTLAKTDLGSLAAIRVPLTSGAGGIGVSNSQAPSGTHRASSPYAFYNGAKARFKSGFTLATIRQSSRASQQP